MTYAQRMRVTFATDESVKYVGHLDMARTWERAIRRARLPLAYSQGFNPQPRIHFAAALPVGFTGKAEVMDIFLDEFVKPGELVARLTAALPPGIQLVDAKPVPREWPSLQSQVRSASYRVEVETNAAGEVLERMLAEFMNRPEVWRERRRGDRQDRYDLRPLVQCLKYTGQSELGQSFEVVMRSEPGATGRPDELLAELGFGSTPRRIVRLGLVFSQEV